MSNADERPVGLLEQLAGELGVPELRSLLVQVLEELGEIKRAKSWYTIAEAARYLRVDEREIKAMLASGRLWRLEGLTQSSRTHIPQAALDSLQERPTLRAVR